MITVLLVDDHVYIRKAIWYFLETTRDIRVIATASNGAEAVTAARFNPPDVVIMDISMPVMNGLDATRQILADFPHMRVLMLSSYDDQGHIQMALEAGAAGYIVKEAIVSELVEAIRSLYSGWRYCSHEIAYKVNSYVEEDSDNRMS